MIKFKSIRTELTLFLFFSLGLILIIISFIYLGQIAQDTRESVKQGLLNTLSLQTQQIEQFIERRGEAVNTMVASPQLISWFEQYRVREKDLSKDTDFPKLVQLFKNLEKRDSAAKAFFFASAITGEYFDSSNQRFSGNESGPYDARKRPWWNEAIKENRLFITQPEMDYIDKTILSAIKRTVYSPSGELIGIAGVDILLSTIETQITSQLKYEGLGEPFLANRDGRIIIFPADPELVKANSDIGDVGSVLVGVEGFKELKQQIQAESHGVAEIQWKGAKSLVAFDGIVLDNPHMDWIAGIIVPATVIDQPISKSIRKTVSIVGAILLLISIAIWLVSGNISRQLKRAVAAIYDVAHGEGDLTQRMKVESENEIGEFANQFNFFVERIHQIMLQNKLTIDQLYQGAEKVTSIANLSASKAKEQKELTNRVVTESEELNFSINSVSVNSDAARSSADEADKQVSTGALVVNEASQSIQTLADSIATASGVVDKLNLDSSRIGEVLEVIRSIADQTNLLALNAAIEAARAGEQGRGFAVVADEVRSLASRTQESTESINKIIEELRTNAKEAVKAMQEGTQQASTSVAKSQLVQEVLQKVADAISQIRSQSNEIALLTGKQAKASTEITRRAVAISELSDESAAQIVEVQEGAREQRSNIHKLAEMIREFKI